MGNELIISAIPLRIKGPKGHMSMEDRERSLLMKVDEMKLSEDDMQEFYWQWCGENAPASEAERKEAAKDTIKDFFISLNDRDVTWVCVPSWQIYLTGGMTWGGNPSESYSCFVKFSALPERLLKVSGFRGG